MPRITFLCEYVFVINLPSVHMKNMVIIKYNKLGGIDKMFKIENTSNRSQILDVDWSRNMIELRYDSSITERFYGMEVETSMRQNCFLASFREWRDLTLKNL